MGVRIPVGIFVATKPPTGDVDEYLPKLHFDSREKLNVFGFSDSSPVSKIRTCSLETVFLQIELQIIKRNNDDSFQSVRLPT